MKSPVIQPSQLLQVQAQAAALRNAADQAAQVEKRPAQDLIGEARERGKEILRARATDGADAPSPAMRSLAVAVRSFDRSVDHLNDMRRLVKLPALDRDAASQLVVDKTLAAVEIVASPASSVRLEPATAIVLDHLLHDYYNKAQTYLGDVFELVRAAAAARGMDAVSPREALALLAAAAYPPNNAEGREKAQQNAFRDHGEVAMVAMKEKSGSYDSQWAQQWLDGFADDALWRLYEHLTDPATILEALGDAAKESSEARVYWRAALLEEIDAMAALQGTARATALARLSPHLEQAIPASVLSPLLEAARKAQAGAVEGLKAQVAEGVEREVTLSVAHDARPSVRAVAMPAVSETIAWRYSGDNHWGVTLGNWAGVDDAVRERAYYAAKEGRAPRFLELTHGLPTSAARWISPQAFRHHGDHLLYWQPGGNGGQGQAHKFETPRTEATVITPHNKLEQYFAGGMPKEFEGWYRRDLGWQLAQSADAPPAEQRAGYAQAVADGVLSVREGDAVDCLRDLAAAGERFDLAMLPELSWTADRIQLLEALQNVLLPGGAAFVSLTTWAPGGMQGSGASNEHIDRCRDTVRVEGRELPLEEYLARTFPEQFEIVRYTGGSALKVTGTEKPVRLPIMDAEVVPGSVQFGLPVIRWEVVGPPPAVEEPSFFDKLLHLFGA